MILNLIVIFVSWIIILSCMRKSKKCNSFVITLLIIGVVVMSIYYLKNNNNRSPSWIMGSFGKKEPFDTKTLSPPPQIGKECTNPYTCLSDIEKLLNNRPVIQKSKPSTSGKGNNRLTAKQFAQWNKVLPEYFRKPFQTSKDPKEGNSIMHDSNKNKQLSEKKDSVTIHIDVDNKNIPEDDGKINITSVPPSKGHDSFNKKRKISWSAGNDDTYSINTDKNI